MKINEVEALVGITKKNIRFYEAEGLLAPRRNSENGYRDYGDAEVDALRRIKLLRKLGVPLEEIRQMQSGGLTVGDGMRRHLVTLERERKNLEAASRLCAGLTDSPERLDTLDAQALLEQMERMEQEGTTFMDKQKRDTKRRRYVVPVMMAAVMSVFMAGLIWLFLWAFEVDPAGRPPLPLLALIVAFPALVILGVLIASIQRIREIGKGEEDEAKSINGFTLPTETQQSGFGGRDAREPSAAFAVRRKRSAVDFAATREKKMKRKSIETQAQRKRQAIVSALVNGCLFAATAAVLLWARHTVFPTGPMSVVLLVLAVTDAASLLPLALILRARLKEIEGGEIDEARQY